MTIREILSYSLDKYINVRMELEEFAMKALKYKPSQNLKFKSNKDLEYYLSDIYKRKVNYL